MKVIPTVLAYDKGSFRELWDRVVPLADEIQVDVMDGKFVETESLPVSELPDVNGMGTKFEAHLMVEDPMDVVPELARKGYYRIIIHYEAITDDDVPRIAAEMRSRDLQWCLAINPDTPVSEVVPHAPVVRDILVMGVHPGRNNAPYVKETPERVKELRERCPTVRIQVDGGMTDETVGPVVRAGASRINSGSFIGSADDPEDALKRLYAAEVAA